MLFLKNENAKLWINTEALLISMILMIEQYAWYLCKQDSDFDSKGETAHSPVGSDIQVYLYILTLIKYKEFIFKWKSYFLFHTLFLVDQ